MALVSGVVEWNGKNKFGKYAIKVGGKFYNSQYEIKCQKDDVVEFDDGDKNYVNKLKVVGGSQPASNYIDPEPKSSHPVKSDKFRDPDQIIRQEALRDAVSFINSQSKADQRTVQAVLDTAAVFEEFVRVGSAVELLSDGPFEG